MDTRRGIAGMVFPTAASPAAGPASGVLIAARGRHCVAGTVVPASGVAGDGRGFAGRESSP